jgi:hypothetical protein
MDYKSLGKDLIQLLDTAHNPSIAKIRGEFFEAEYNFFRKNIRNKNVLVLGSGLGHDAFELVKYNNYVVGWEIVEDLTNESTIRKKCLDFDSFRKIYFENLDFVEIGKSAGYYYHHVSVLNMGTFGNFENKEEVLESIIRLTPTAHLDFYAPGKDNTNLRKKMYEEEGYKNVKIKGDTVYTDYGLSSEAISKDNFLEIFYKVAKKNPEYELDLEFTDFYKFATMATISSR